MRFVRYIRRKRYMLDAGWYRNILGAFVASHGEMVVPMMDIYKMSDTEFLKICPYFK